MTKLFSISLVLLVASFLYPDSKPRKTNAVLKPITNPFDTLAYDKVIAYDFKGDGDKNVVQAIKLKLVTAQKELKKTDVKRINKILGDTSTYGGQTAACFDPHFGMIYYKENKIVGHISICLQCNFLQASVTIPATEIKKHFVGDGPDDFIYAHGFSVMGRKQISRFVKSLKFSHWELKSELFDQKSSD